MHNCASVVDMFASLCILKVCAAFDGAKQKSLTSHGKPDSWHDICRSHKLSISSVNLVIFKGSLILKVFSRRWFTHTMQKQSYFHSSKENVLFLHYNQELGLNYKTIVLTTLYPRKSLTPTLSTQKSIK